MALEREAALEAALARADEWQSWRALRLAGEAPPELPSPPAQDEMGAFPGPGGGASPGSTGEALCHLAMIGLVGSGPAAIAADWLEDARTPAGAWLDAPAEAPGELDDPGGARVWATAAAACGLLAAGRDPGPRWLQLLSGDSRQDGRVTGGAYPTFAAAGAFWLGQGPKTELAEWALRWAREAGEQWWGPWERASGLTFWAAAGIPAEHPTVEMFLEDLVAGAPPEGWPDDVGLTLRSLEAMAFFGY